MSGKRNTQIARLARNEAEYFARVDKYRRDNLSWWTRLRVWWHNLFHESAILTQHEPGSFKASKKFLKKWYRENPPK